MPAGHLVAHAELPLHGHVDLDHLDDAGWKIVALAHHRLLLVAAHREQIQLFLGLFLDLLDLVPHVVRKIGLEQGNEVEPLQQLLPGQAGALREFDFSRGRVHAVLDQVRADHAVHDALVTLLAQDPLLIVVIAVDGLDVVRLDRQRPLIAVRVLPVEHANVHDHALDP